MYHLKDQIVYKLLADNHKNYANSGWAAEINNWQNEPLEWSDESLNWQNEE